MQEVQDPKTKIEYGVSDSGNFQECMKSLESEKYTLISLEELARFITTHEDEYYKFLYERKFSHPPGENPSGLMEKMFIHNNVWTREGILYIPGDGIFLTKSSPAVKNPGRLARAHTIDKEYHLSNRSLQITRANAVRIFHKNNQPIKVSMDELPDHEWTAFAFGEYAESFANLLNSIKETPSKFDPHFVLFPIDREKYLDKKNKFLPYIRQANFSLGGNWLDSGHFQRNYKYHLLGIRNDQRKI